MLKTFYSIEEWDDLLGFYHQNRKPKYNDPRWKNFFGISFSTLQLIWYYISVYYKLNFIKLENEPIKPIHLFGKN
jgi:hypothetical protein